VIKIAIAVNGGHVSRAIDFYNKAGKYFIIGGTTPWSNEASPDVPNISDFKLMNVVGLKKVDNTYMVIPDDAGTINYRNQNWKIVPLEINTNVGASGVSSGSLVVTVTSLAGLVVGSKIRVNNIYDARIVSISSNSLTLDTPAPVAIVAGSPVLGGAHPEGAKYVYVESYLNYDDFPLVTYRQLGLCSGVTPNTDDILLSAAYAATGNNEYTSLGTLEILDNRVPSTRDANQRELVSIILEF